MRLRKWIHAGEESERNDERKAVLKKWQFLSLSVRSGIWIRREPIPAAGVYRWAVGGELDGLKK